MHAPKATGLLITACAAGAALVGFAQQAPKQLTARELFYSAAVTKPSVPRPQAGPQKSAPTPVRVTPPPSNTTSTPSTPPKSAQPMATPASSTSAPIINASDRVQTAAAPEAGPALGLRYTVLKRSAGEMREVPVNSVFVAGDKIQLKVEANVPGYLYIIAQGSSGTWKPMFPSAEVEDGNNRVDGWRSYTMPPRSVMTFDEQKGTERIFIVLSREPEPDLEKMIYSLQGGGSAPQPAAAPETAPTPQRQLVQYASANIEDSMVGRLRQTYSRDLIIEKVDPNTPGDRKETAVYVVNPTGSTSSRVVADLSLVHQ